MDVPEGPIAWFLADGLLYCSHHIMSHSRSGSSVFSTSDHGDHHCVMTRGWAHQNILYSNPFMPTDLNDEVHIAFSKANEVCCTSPYLFSVPSFGFHFPQSKG